MKFNNFEQENEVGRLSIFLKLKDSKYRNMFYVYSFLMVLFYMGYIFLDNHRLNKSELWLSKNSLTAEDVESINRVGMWTSSFEFLFIILFITMSILCLIKNREDKKILKQFLSVNILLFIGVVALGCLIFLVTPLPIGNIMQPLFIPTFIFGGLLLYLLWNVMVVQINTAQGK